MKCNVTTDTFEGRFTTIKLKYLEKHKTFYLIAFVWKKGNCTPKLLIQNMYSCVTNINIADKKIVG
jgi:hypothetical protein